MQKNVWKQNRTINERMERRKTTYSPVNVSLQNLPIAVGQCRPRQHRGMEVVHERNLPFHGQLHRLIGSAQPICHATRSLAALHGEPRSLHYYSERIPAMSQRNVCLENTAEKWVIRFGCLYQEVGMYLFDDRLVVLCMSRIQVL